MCGTFIKRRCAVARSVFVSGLFCCRVFCCRVRVRVTCSFFYTGTTRGDRSICDLCVARPHGPRVVSPCERAIHRSNGGLEWSVCGVGEMRLVRPPLLPLGVTADVSVSVCERVQRCVVVGRVGGARARVCAIYLYTAVYFRFWFVVWGSWSWLWLRTVCGKWHVAHMSYTCTCTLYVCVGGGYVNVHIYIYYNILTKTAALYDYNFFLKCAYPLRTTTCTAATATAKAHSWCKCAARRN